MERLAARVAHDPSFLAAALSAYQRGTRLGDEALAEKLGCEIGALARVRLCRMPSQTAPDFWRDISLVADRFSLDPDALAEVVRHGQSVLRLQAAPDAPGSLVAARDADDPDRPPGPGGPT